MAPTIVEHDLPAMLTADEAAQLLRIRKAQVYAYARDGVVPSVRVGRTVRFNRKQLLSWIDNGGSRHQMPQVHK